MKILHITNYPSPYRVDFFNELGKSVNLTVVFFQKPNQQKHRNAAWFNEKYTNFKACFLKKKFGIGKRAIYIDVIHYLKSDYDLIILGGYSAPTLMLAIEYLRARRIPFCMEIDGGLINKDKPLKYAIKRRYLSAASTYFSSGKTGTDYLVHYGAKRDRIFEYPFTSMWASEVLEKLLDSEEKEMLRTELGIDETQVVISVGNFVYRKGFDVLIKAATRLKENIGLYIIGGEPTAEYINLRQVLGLKNIHFVGFKTKQELSEYYKAADIFVLPTRSDVWGLVVSEAMAHGLPVVTTDRCGAGLDLIRDGINGYIVPIEDHEALAEGILKVLDENTGEMGKEALVSIKEYTIENMAGRHLDVFKEILFGNK